MKSKVSKISIIFLFMFLLSVFIVNTQTEAISNVNKNSTTNITSLASSYTNVSSISITSNTAFASAATTYGWSGTGTAASPYLISGMHFNSTTAYQLYIDAVTANFTIQNNVFEGGSQDTSFWNLYLWSDSGNIIIDSNTFQNSKQGMLLAYSTSVTVTNNIMHMDGSSNSQGMYLWDGVTSLNVSNNLITDSHLGMEFDSSNALVYNNTIQNTISGGTDILNNYGQNENYTTNIFTGSHATGITLTGTSEVYYHQNISTTNLINGKPEYYLLGATSGSVPSNSAKVYLVDCIGVTVSGVQTASSVDYSVYLFNSTNIDITGNTLTSSLDTVTGVNSNNLTISGNTLTSTSGKALNLLTVNNTITNNQFYGQVTLKTNTNVQRTVTGNYVNGGEMVYMLNQNNQVIQNAGWVYIFNSSNIQINNSELDFLSIFNSTNIQITNAYTANVGFTTNIDYSKDVTFKNVTFINGAIEFDFYYDVNVQVIGSTFSQMFYTSNYYSVLYFSYSNNTVIRDSTFSNILNDDAVYFDYGVNNINLQNNRFNQVKTRAVYVYPNNPSTVSITYNTFNSGDTGVSLYGTSAKIQFNTFEKFFDYGIDLESANNLISFNIFRDNTGYAIYAYDVNQTITNNVFKTNFDGIYLDTVFGTDSSLVKNNYFTNSGNYVANFYSSCYTCTDSAIQVWGRTNLVITGNVFNYDVSSLYIDSSATNILVTKNAFLGLSASMSYVWSTSSANSNFTANYYDDYTGAGPYSGSVTDYNPLASNPYTSFSITAPSNAQYALNATSKTYSFTYNGPWSSYVVASVDNQVVFNGAVNPAQTVSLTLDSLGVGTHVVKIVGPTAVTASVFVYNPNNYIVVQINTTTVINTAVSTTTIGQNGGTVSTTSSNANSSPGFTIISIFALLMVVPVIAYRKKQRN